MQHEYQTLFCTHCGHPRKVVRPCGNRFCPICTGGQKNRAKRKLTAIVNRVRLRRPYTLKHLTLTIPNVVKPEWGVDTLIACFRRLRQRSFWTHHVNGGAYVIEITNIGNGWHVHLHVIIEARWIPWKRLRDLWMKISPGRGTWITEAPPAATISYLTDYLYKVGLSEHHQIIASRALRNRRLFTTFGTWHKIRVRVPHPEFACPICQRTRWIHEQSLHPPSDRRSQIWNPG